MFGASGVYYKVPAPWVHFFRKAARPLAARWCQHILSPPPLTAATSLD